MQLNVKKWVQFIVIQSYIKDIIIYKTQKEIINTALKSQLYDWVVGLYDSATILLSYKEYKKILINPKINDNDLNNITNYEIRNTYVFFDSEYKKEYKLFKSVYPHSIWFPKMKELRLSDIKEKVSEILSLSQLDLIRLKKGTDIEIYIN